MKRIITAVKSTGSSMHLGNLLGAVLPFKQVAEGKDAAIFIADLHSLTTVKSGDDIRRNGHEMAMAYFSVFGLDTKVHIFRQSDIVLLPKLNWILNNVTPYSLMLRAHSFKDSENKLNEWKKDQEILIEGQIDIAFEKLWLDNVTKEERKSILLSYINKYFKENPPNEAPSLNMGVFNYPILMAADIIGYGIDIVPVGADQKQHLEMTRDIARAFNKTYNSEIFTLPEAHIEPSVAILPGTDGQKMSKSKNNFIGIFDDDKTLKKRVMSIVTDSKGVDDIKDPETCHVFALIKTFASPERTESIRAKYLAPGYGYGHAKLELLEILTEYLRPIREKRAMLEQNLDLVEAKLQEGARVMNARMNEKMEEVKKVVGL